MFYLCSLLFFVLVFFLSFIFFFFFFQAEDGIRDGHVTGVQTCALPIWIHASLGEALSVSLPRRALGRVRRLLTARVRRVQVVDRSEERRVGKECRWRWWGDQ